MLSLTAWNRDRDIVRDLVCIGLIRPFSADKIHHAEQHHQSLQQKIRFLGFSPPNTPEIVVEKSVKSVEMLPVVRTSFSTLANSMAVMLPTTKMKMQTGIRSYLLLFFISYSL